MPTSERNTDKKRPKMTSYHVTLGVRGGWGWGARFQTGIFVKVYFGYLFSLKLNALYAHTSQGLTNC